MSIEAYKWAWKQPVRGIDKLVLLALAEYASKQIGYKSWPSLDKLAVMLVGEGEPTPQRKTVTRALANLERSGYIKRDRSTGGNGRSTRYRLPVKQGHSDPVEQGHSDPPSGTQAPATGTLATTEQGHSDPRSVSDPLKTACAKRTWPCRRCETQTANESELCGRCSTKDWQERKRGNPGGSVWDEYTGAFVATRARQ